jgi:glyoxylase-like metal-dependent hydrolase (beta-lactamase superfamily II)
LALPADIQVLPLPTPFAIGNVNCVVLEGKPLTVVDPGPHMHSTREAFEAGLGEHGHQIGDIEQVLLTHQHHDHVGLAAEIAAEAGAKLAAIDPLADFLADFDRSMDHDDRYAVETMVRSGIERKVAVTLRSMSAAFRVFGRGAEVDRRLDAGDVFEAGGRGLRVLFRPGHSPTDTVFLDAESGLLIGGDHLLERISSNPIAHAPIGADDPEAAARSSDRPRPLLDYLESMRATRELDISLVLPGHGDPFTDAAALIDRRIEFHDRRARKIRGALERPMTASEIVSVLWANLPVTQTYLALSEVIGHLDMLIDAGEAEMVLEGDDVVRYAPS